MFYSYNLQQQLCKENIKIYFIFQIRKQAPGDSVLITEQLNSQAAQATLETFKLMSKVHLSFYNTKVSLICPKRKSFGQEPPVRTWFFSSLLYIAIWKSRVILVLSEYENSYSYNTLICLKISDITDLMVNLFML